MKYAQIEDIIKKRYKKIDIALNRVIKDFNIDEIHLFRIEVKKLRSFIRLIEVAVNDKHRRKLPKKLHEFNNALGIIRSLQIQQHHVQIESKVEFAILPKTHINWLTTKIVTTIDRAKEMAKGKKPFKKGAHRVLSNIPNKLKETILRKFINLKVNTLEKLLEPSFITDESLHLIRKSLKDLLYTWPYIKKETPVILSSTVFSSQKNITLITKLLGDFQDTCGELNLLSVAHIKQCPNKKERTFLHTIEKELLNEKETIRKEIYKIFQKNCPS